MILWLIKIIKEYHFPPNQIDVFVPAGVGRDAGNRNTPVRADIVVYRDSAKTQSFIVIETKAPEEKKGLAQAESYSRNLGAEYHVWSNGQYDRFYVTSRYPTLSEIVSDIPRWVGEKPIAQKIPKTQILPPFKDEVELRQIIRQCHELILEKQGHDPAKAFDEMAKLLFLKLYDEREIPEFYEFAVLVGETSKVLAERMRNLFSNSVMSSKYKDVFFSRYNKAPDLSLELDDFTIFKLVQLLQGYSLVNTTENINGADIKGTVYEHMVGDTFRGELAQFFTPREIVEFMVNVVKPTKEDVIFDYSCGSGGFLIMTLRKVKEDLKKNFPNLSKSDRDQSVKHFAEHNAFGTDINERMVRVAKMNMIMHGDGHAGIIHTNGLLTDPDIPEDFVKRLHDTTVLLSNPPFAGREKDPAILSQFTLGRNKDEDPISVSKELVFIENAIQLVRPHARVGLVLPSGCFNNPSPVYVRTRKMLREKTKITALIALPHPAFRVSGANNEGNLIFFERTDKPPADYDIFIDWAQYVGFDDTGRKLPYNDLPTILKRMENPKPANIIRFSKLEDRIDPWYYHPKYKELEKAVANTKYELKPISELVVKSDSLFDPKAHLTESFSYIETNDVDLDNGIIITSMPVTGKSAPNRATYILKEGDFMIPNAMHCVRGIAVVPKEFEGYICTNRFFVVRPKRELVNPVYLYHILKQPVILALLKRQATGEINPGLSMSKSYNALEKVKIPVPSLPEQEILVKQINEKEKKRKELLREAEEYDQSLFSLVAGTLPRLESPGNKLAQQGYEYISFL